MRHRRAFTTQGKQGEELEDWRRIGRQWKNWENWKTLFHHLPVLPLSSGSPSSSEFFPFPPTLRQHAAYDQLQRVIDHNRQQDQTEPRVHTEDQLRHRDTRC